MHQIKELLDSVSKLQFQTNEPSIFEMIGKAESETVYSSFIGNLINPSFHEGGQECLVSFIDMLSQKGEIFFDADNLKVIETEYDFGKITGGTYPTGGRADIYLEDVHHNVIVIENKIYAGDQKNQLLRYHNSLIANKKINHNLVYLTLDGKMPSAKSLGKIKAGGTVLNPDSVISLSYAEISSWLPKTIDICKDTISQHIIQFQNTLNQILMDRAIINDILSSGETYQAALVISKSIEKSRLQLKHNFLNDLKNALPDEFLAGEISKNKKGVISLPIEKDNIKACIQIDWRLAISSGDARLKLNKGSWEHIGQKNDYNFHDCSKKVKDYLSASSKEEVLANVLEQIHKIFDRAANLYCDKQASPPYGPTT